MFQGLKRRVSDMGVIRALCLDAEAYARKDGQHEPGAEHFVLAAFDLPDGSARRAFQRAGGAHEQFEAALAAQHAGALRAIGVTVDVDLEPAIAEPAEGIYEAAASGRELMQTLAARGQSGDRSPLVGAHVVAAVAAMPRGVVARTLRAMNVDREMLRLAAIEESGVAGAGR